MDSCHTYSLAQCERSPWLVAQAPFAEVQITVFESMSLPATGRTGGAGAGTYRQRHRRKKAGAKRGSEGNEHTHSLARIKGKLRST
jgi:hypothetical protein